MSAAPTQIEDLGKTIKVRIEKGDKATKDAEGHYLAAGIHLKEAMPLVARRADMTWVQFLDQHCNIKKSRANDLVRLANGTTTLAEIRESTRTRMAAMRAKRPSRDGRSEEIHAADQRANSDSIERDVNPENYRSAFLMRADTAIQMAVYSGKPTKETVDWARRASEAWDGLARSMEGATATTAKTVNEFHRELLGFVEAMEKRITKWFENNPKADKEAKDTIYQSLWLSADQLNKIAQKLDGR